MLIEIKTPKKRRIYFIELRMFFPPYFICCFDLWIFVYILYARQWKCFRSKQSIYAIELSQYYCGRKFYMLQQMHRRNNIMGMLNINSSISVLYSKCSLVRYWSWRWQGCLYVIEWDGKYTVSAGERRSLKRLAICQTQSSPLTPTSSRVDPRRTVQVLI